MTKERIEVIKEQIGETPPYWAWRMVMEECLNEIERLQKELEEAERLVESYSEAATHPGDAI